jgi:dolichyl-phosphate beta-glucosyltransferase
VKQNTNNETDQTEAENQGPELSIIIPCFNEAARVEPVVEAGASYFDANEPSYEFILVDDGSMDNTRSLLNSLAARPGRTMRVIGHDRNKGKGAAVRSGLKAAKGTWCLVADADGAAPWSGYDELRDAVTSKTGACVGSRFGERVVAKMNRKIAGWIFRTAIRHIVNTGVEDTQCGFKLLRSSAIKPLLGQMVTTGYCADIEILARLKRAGWDVNEVRISWVHQEGSKIHVVRDGIKMLLETRRIAQTLKENR